MNTFWEGFEKRAVLGGPATAIGGWTDKGRESSKVRAKQHARMVADAVKARKDHPVEYFLNPMVPGPLTEAVRRVARRHTAAAAEKPHHTGWIPGYGAIRGGKAGEKTMKKTSSPIKELVKRHGPGVLKGMALGGVAGTLASTSKGRGSSKARAESRGMIAGDATKARKTAPLQYLFNPAVPGPLTEAGTRLRRRIDAAMVDKPFITGVSPYRSYGLAAGGEAGEKQIKKHSK